MHGIANARRAWPMWLALLVPVSAPADTGGLRPLSTDRPSLTESPYTVDPGHVQLEWGMLTQTVTRIGSADLETRSHTGFLLKTGVHPIVDVEVIADPRIRVGRDATYYTDAYIDSGLGVAISRHTTRAEYSYLGPTIVRMKIHTLGQEDDARVAMALIPFMTVHGGDFDASVHGMAIPVLLRAGDRWSVGGMVQGSIFSEELIALTTAVLTLAVTPALDAFVEFAGERIATTPSPWATIVNSGSAWRPFANLQLDGAIGFGVFDSASDWTATVGLTVRR